MPTVQSARWTFSRVLPAPHNASAACETARVVPNSSCSTPIEVIDEQRSRYVRRIRFPQARVFRPALGVTGERRPEMDTNERLDEKRRRRTIIARARTFYPRGAESDCR